MTKMPRFGRNSSKYDVNKVHNTVDSCSRNVVANPMSSSDSASTMPFFSAVEAIRFRRAIRRCRPLLIKDLDPVDVVDNISASTKTAAAAALRTETVRESMLGSASSREERTGALLDRLESVCFDADGSLSSAGTLSAFVATLRRNYRHVFAVLNETARQLADDEVYDDDFNVYTEDEDIADNLTPEDVDRATDTPPTVRQCRRERVAIAGDSVRKLLRRVDMRNRREETQNGREDGTGSLNEDHAQRGHYSSPTDGGTSDFIDCYVVPTRGRLQRKEPWIRHCSSSEDKMHVSQEDEADLPAYMMVLTKDLMFKRVNMSSLDSEIQRQGDSLPTSTQPAGSQTTIYVVDIESQYSPVTVNCPPSSIRLCQEHQPPPPLENKDDRLIGDHETAPIPPTRSTSAALSSLPPPLPPKPQNLFYLSGMLRCSPSPATVNPEASPPLPVRQVRNLNEDLKSTGRSKLPPSPPSHSAEPDMPSVDDVVHLTSAAEMAEPNEHKSIPDNGDDTLLAEAKYCETLVKEAELDFKVRDTSTTNDYQGSDVLSNDVSNHQTPPIQNSDLIVKWTSRNSNSESDIVVQSDDRENLVPTATRDSGIDSILSSNGFNDSPISQTGSTFTPHDDEEEIERKSSIDLLHPVVRMGRFEPAPSLSDILIGVDDNTDEFHRRQSRIEDEEKAGTLKAPRCRSMIDEDDFSYYEDIDLLEAASRTYLDPRSASFNSADGVSVRRRSRISVYSPNSAVVRRNSSVPPAAAAAAAASSRAHHHIQASQSTSSLAFFLQPQADRKVLPAGTLLIAERTATGDASELSSNITASSSLYAQTRSKKTESDDERRGITIKCHDREGLVYHVPAEALRRHGDPTEEPWFFPVPLSARDATLFLQREDQRGVFVIYKPKGGGETLSPPVVYNLSVSLGRGGDVLHYPIVRNRHGDVAIVGHDHSFLTVAELVTYFRRNRSGLATRLGRSLREARLPIAAGCQYPIRFELRRSDLNVGEGEIGSSRFGSVVVARYRSSTFPDDRRSRSRHQNSSLDGDPVLVKMLTSQRSSPDDDDEFLEEALVLMGLQHDNVARLIGISFSTRPFCVVVEWSDRGTLADCLRSGFLRSDENACEDDVTGSVNEHRRARGEFGAGFDARFNVSVQVVSAMVYLESRRYVLHRAVAAKSIIVSGGDESLVKLANFDRARLVSDDDYQADPDEPVLVRWAAPEVLTESRYSSKSDVWALGILLWEIFSGGAEPYSSMDAERTAVYVVEGGRLERPIGCPLEIYSMMKLFWQADPDERPSFATLNDKIRGESSIYYTCPSSQPSSTFHRSCTRATSSAARSLSDADRLPPPLPPPLSSRCQKSSTLLPLPIKTKPNINKPVTPTSRRPLLADVTAERGSRTPSAVRTGNGSNAGFSDSCSINSISTNAVGLGDDLSDDLTRGEKIRKSLRKLITNKNKVSK